ncbi:hypothetical protein Tco_1328356 [Tanacetum coccineum]
MNCLPCRQHTFESIIPLRPDYRMFEIFNYSLVVGDVSSEGAFYLITGAATVMLLGTTFRVLFSRKDTCLYLNLFILKGGNVAVKSLGELEFQNE